MSKQPNNLSYNDMTDEEKKDFIITCHLGMNLSIPEIAKACGTYTNKVRRDAIKLGIKLRSRSEAQKININKEGRHPTKGKALSEETKQKIGDRVADKWQSLSDEEREKRNQQNKEIWDSRTEADKELFKQKGQKAVRKAAVEGSKLEKFLYSNLIENGYVVRYHEEHLLLNRNLHIDILLPNEKIAIEVDGASHHEDIWSQNSLHKTKKADSQKEGLLTSCGYVLIRIVYHRTPSAKYMREALKNLINKIEEIKKEWPSKDKRIITMGLKHDR